MDPQDPYAPPQADVTSPPANPAAFGELVRAWEKLRLLFNALLLLPGIAVLMLWVKFAHMPVPIAIFLAVLIGFGANVAFFMGPMAELYFRALFLSGAPLGRGRWLIFGAGLVVSAGFFVLAALLATASTEGEWAAIQSEMWREI